MQGHTQGHSSQPLTSRVAAYSTMSSPEAGTSPSTFTPLPPSPQLGKLTAAFAALMERLFGGPWLPEAERKQFDPHMAGSSSSAAAEESARACLGVAAACMKHGNGRLLALVLAVLPPLQRE